MTDIASASYVVSPRQFSFCGTEEFAKSNIRASGELEPLGCLGDLGWYNLRFSLWVMNYQLPLRVSGRMLTELRRIRQPVRCSD